MAAKGIEYNTVLVRKKAITFQSWSSILTKSMIQPTRMTSESEHLPLSKKQHRSKEQLLPNKCQKIDSTEKGHSVMDVEASVGVVTCSNPELASVAVHSVTGKTNNKQSPETTTRNPDRTESPIEDSSKTSESIQILKAALEELLPLNQTINPTVMEHCHSTLQSLLQLTFSEALQSSGIHRVIKKFQKHPSLGKLADRNLVYWFLDWETGFWIGKLVSGSKLWIVAAIVMIERRLKPKWLFSVCMWRSIAVFLWI